MDEIAWQKNNNYNKKNIKKWNIEKNQQKALFSDTQMKTKQ